MKWCSFRQAWTDNEKLLCALGNLRLGFGSKRRFSHAQRAEFAPLCRCLAFWARCRNVGVTLLRYLLRHCPVLLLVMCANTDIDIRRLRWNHNIGLDSIPFSRKIGYFLNTINRNLSKAILILLKPNILYSRWQRTFSKLKKRLSEVFGIIFVQENLVVFSFLFEKFSISPS